jgi:hypothetical protein
VDTTLIIKIACAVIAVILVFVIIKRRRSKAAK